MANSFRSIASKIFGALRTGWLILGVWIVLLLLVESCVRVKNAVARQRQQSSAGGPYLAGDPYAETWYKDFMVEYDATRPQRWRPYVQFGRQPSYSGRFIAIDSAGHRIVPQPTTSATPAAKVFMFGGSTMWGDSQRGDHNIASETSTRLQKLAGAAGRVEVTNFGESGYVSTQEIIQLEQQLQAGNVPDVVIFFDGLNDVASTVQSGVAGLPQNESKRVKEFTMGRALDRAGFARGLGKDTRAMGLLAGQALQQLELTDWVLAKKKAPNATYISADSASRATVRTYANNVRIVEALASRFGFQAVYVWQPNLHTSAKVPNAYEKRLLARIGRDPFHGRLQETHRILPPMLDSAMTTAAPGRFVDATGLFKGDTLSVYTDWLGHNTEVSVPYIVDAFWPLVEKSTQSALATRALRTSSSPVPSNTVQR